MSEIRAPLLRPMVEYHKFDLAKMVANGFKCVAFSEGVASLIGDLVDRYEQEQLYDVAPLPTEYGFLDLTLLDVFQGKKSDIGFLIEPHVRGIMVSCLRRSKDSVEAVGLFGYSDRPVINSELCQKLLELGSFGNLKDEFGIRSYLRPLAGIFVAACAVLAAPGVRSVSESRKAPWARKMRQPCPHVEYRCIDIDIDALASIPEVGAPMQGGGSPKALHHVRGHLRLTEKGLVPVKPHWRGNVLYGTKLRDFNIKRTEEMH